MFGHDWCVCAAHYQTVLTLLLGGLLGLYLWRQTGAPKPPTSGPLTAAAAADAPQSPLPSPSPSGSTPYLWTVDNSPIYGSPMCRRTTPTQVCRQHPTLDLVPDPFVILLITNFGT